MRDSWQCEGNAWGVGSRDCRDWLAGAGERGTRRAGAVADLGAGFETMGRLRDASKAGTGRSGRRRVVEVGRIDGLRHLSER